jgi:hypothetical protein
LTTSFGAYVKALFSILESAQRPFEIEGQITDSFITKELPARFYEAVPALARICTGGQPEDGVAHLTL